MATKKAAKKTKQSAGDAVDEQLGRYREMRDFNVTAEPSGAEKKAHGGALPFVIQKHAATRLHYDFRLGWNGVLKSWAVAKGPSYNVHDKRLAVQVEDHPMEYGGFEGIIPRGQYGGGTVMVWDQGTWEPHVDVDEGLRKGSLKFALNGTKMHGNWTLVRMGGKAAQEGKPNWLLIKEHDKFERAADDPCITEEMPNSAVTGRTLEEIATASTHVWNSKETASEGQAWYRQRARDADAGSKPAKKVVAKAKEKTSLPGLDALPQESLPEFLKPQLAQETQAPPSGPDWLHELKLDGYRIQARKRGTSVELFTRSGLDWTHRMKPVAEAIKELPVEDAIFDGEVVVLDDAGLSSFARLQASFERNEKHSLTFFVFDLLHLNGRNTRDMALRERKRLLHGIMNEDNHVLRFNEDLAGEGAKIFHAACELHAEGILSKRADGVYQAGRSTQWVKSKCLFEQEFVVGGWVDLSNGSHGVGALLLGYYDDKGKLIYTGRTGTGFTQKTHKMLRDRLDAIEQKTMPFAAINAEGRRGAHWVKPEIVVQVRFATWTADQQVRQASYQGLREDKAANEVRREMGPPSAKHKATKAAIAEMQALEEPVATKPAKKSAKAQPSAPLPPMRLTHPDKVVDPESGVTKQQLAEYLWAVSANMLPHITDRPLSLVRCPEGSSKPCFYQKHVNHMLPKGVGSVMVSDKKGGTPEPYITLNSAEALTGLAQMSVLEIHPWGSCNAELERPNRIIIDLDPDESLPWEKVCEAAHEVRSLLQAMNLESFVKTTGGKGLHVVFPLEAEHDFATMKTWTHGFVQAMEKANPTLYLSKMSKAARTGKIYLDYLRNERGATAVAPYSMRSRLGLPVSMPLDWKEVTGKERSHFSIRNAAEWLHRLGNDPWKKLLTVRQQLSKDALEHFAGETKRS